MLFWLLSAVILKSVVPFSLELVYDNSVDLCIKNVIEKMFGKEDVIHFLIQDPFSYEAIYEVPNPKVIVSLNATISEGATNVGKNFLIQVDDGNSLEAALSYLETSVIWNRTWSALGKFLVLTTEKNMSFVFKTLWSRNLIRSVVFSLEENNATPNIYTSSPYLKENKCGMNPIKFDVHSCPNPSLNNAIKPVLTNYGGCTVEYVLNFPKTNVETKIEWCEYSLRFVTFLFKGSKMFPYPRIGSNQDLKPPVNNRIRFIASIRDPYDPRYQVSKVTVTENFVWLVPPPKRISLLKVYFIIFNYKVWISVVVCFLAVCFIWWVRTRDSFSHVLINVFSITLFASYPSVPKVTTLKLLLFLYIVYSIHIQTAYHSILFKVLTIPQYESKIESLPELADSNLSIYTRVHIITLFFSNNISDYPLYTKIKGQLIIDYNMSNREVTSTCNHAVLGSESNFKQLQFVTKSLMTNNIIDNCVTGPLHYAFLMPRSHYVVETVNYFIDVFLESGLAQKIKNDVNHYNNKHLATFEENYEAKPLTLHQLYGIFVICGGMLIVSVFVFFIEVIVGKLKKKNKIHGHNFNN